MTLYCGKCKQSMIPDKGTFAPNYYKCDGCGIEVYEVPMW